MTDDAPADAGVSEPDMGDSPRRNRTPIAERATRRRRLEAGDADRYQSLFRHLTAGRPLTSARRTGLRARWHPIARRLLVVSLLVAGVYAGLTLATQLAREFRVDTWAGPDATVTSGQRLDGCPDFIRNGDAVFPNWIRIDGMVFHHTGAQLPVGGTNIGTYYLDSGYTLGELRIFRVDVEGLGEPGTRILVRAGTAPAGGLYAAIPGCS